MSPKKSRHLGGKTLTGKTKPMNQLKFLLYFIPLLAGLMIGCTDPARDAERTLAEMRGEGALVAAQAAREYQDMIRDRLTVITVSSVCCAVFLGIILVILITILVNLNRKKESHREETAC